MSKVTAEISHKKRIQDNILNIETLEERTIREQHDNLKKKMAAIEEKRTKKLEEKVKGYKNNEEKWVHKHKEIQTKIK